MRSRSRVIGYGGAAVLVVVGIVGGVIFGGTFGQLFALVVVSLGLIQAVALVFYEVGLSEDRERAREERERARQERERAGEAAERAREAAERGREEARRHERTQPGQPRRRLRLDRRRGQRRRLD
jgi:hypothetical protein